MPRRTSNHSNGPSPLPILVILALLLLVGYFAYIFWKEQAQPTPPTTASQPAESVISDDRMLFGGAPIPHRPDITFTTLKNIAYIVGYSETRKDPLWSAHRLMHIDHPYILERPKGEFLTDMRTEARVTHHDFTGSGFDRGHMTPNSAIARCYGAEAQKETFLLSNICPQAPALNQKVWEKLEMETMAYADTYNEVWVICGPIFADLNGGATRTLRAGIAVPTSFYKILIEDHDGIPQDARVFSVIMPQTVRGTELPQQYLTSIHEIETETQLDFLTKLDPATRQQLESKVFPMW